MTDIEKALERWRIYADGLSYWDAEPAIAIGWCHDELVRRGYVIDTTDNTTRGPSDHAFTMALREWDNCSVIGNQYFEAPAALGCYLDAIEATEPKCKTQT